MWSPHYTRVYKGDKYFESGIVPVPWWPAAWRQLLPEPLVPPSAAAARVPVSPCSQRPALRPPLTVRPAHSTELLFYTLCCCARRRCLLLLEGIVHVSSHGTTSTILCNRCFPAFSCSQRASLVPGSDNAACAVGTESAHASGHTCKYRYTCMTLSSC